MDIIVEGESPLSASSVQKRQPFYQETYQAGTGVMRFKLQDVGRTFELWCISKFAGGIFKASLAGSKIAWTFEMKTSPYYPVDSILGAWRALTQIYRAKVM